MGKDGGMSHQAVTWALCYWKDASGRSWALPQPNERLVFTRLAHAALRAHIYARDGYRCCECGAKAQAVPAPYDGRKALFIVATTRKGNRIPLVLDHRVSLRNGGRTHPDNLQTLCAICNNTKATRIDRVAGRVTQ
jgi:5-methylcytosine-specific restriction endonuclease McrA